MPLTTPRSDAGMRGLLALSTLVLFAACNTSSPGYRGVPPTRVTVEGSVFDVRVVGNRAEAIRVNRQYAPRFGPIQARAGQAMAMVSGCVVVEVLGDQAQAFGRLDCGDGPPPRRIDPQAVACEPIRGTLLKGVGEINAALDCYPV